MKDPNYLRHFQLEYRDKVAALVEKCSPEKNKPGKNAQYMRAVELLGYNEDLNVLQGLKAIENKDEGKLDFSAVETEV